MAGGIQEVLETALRVSGAAQFASQMTAAGTASSLAGAAIGQVTGLMSPLTAAFAGFTVQSALSNIAEVNSRFEESQRLIAGIYATMGMSGDFNSGLQMAANTMDMITVAAAALPGEAEDYINVFQTGLTVVRQSMHGTVEEMVGFTNRYTAIMSTLGVNSAESAQTLNRALAAGRGMVDQQSQAFQRLLPFIQQATQGTAHQVSNVAQFNQLTQEQRQQVLQLTLNQQGLVAMLNDAGSSWNAQVGTLQSLVSMMTRLATDPLFDAMKSYLSDFNGLFLNSEGHLTDLGNTLVAIGNVLSTNLVTSFGQIVDAASTLAAGAGEMFAGLQRSGALQDLDRLAVLLTTTYSAGLTAIIQLAGQAGQMFANMVNDLERSGTLDLLLAIASNTTGMGQVLMDGLGEGLQNAFDILGVVIEGVTPFLLALSNQFESLWRYGSALGAVFSDFVEGVGPGFLDVMYALMIPLFQFLDGTRIVGAIMLEELQPQLMGLWNAIGQAAELLAASLIPLFTQFGGTGQTFDLVLHMVIGALQMTIQTITNVINAMVSFTRIISQVTGMTYGGGHSPSASIPGQQVSLLDQIRQTMERMRHQAAQSDSAAQAAARRETPPARGGSRVHQDFRNSRFDIMQRFAEGFDPDRIAVAFADDLERLGEQRLQSGLEPLFGIR